MDLQSLSLQAPPSAPPITPLEDMMIATNTNTNTINAPLLPLQQEHIQPREPYSGIPFANEEKPPSWMLPNDRPMLNIPSSSSSLQLNRRKPSFAGHGRSVSEFTLPPLSSNHITNNNNNNNLTPPPTTQNRNRSHRRAVSANTVDFMLSHTSITTQTTTTDIRAQSYSPQEKTLNTHIAPNNNQFFEQLDVSSTADTSGRYVCPYCNKKFSRPSSLRIHTYSHTGEKPFVCTEPGCGRHFSVQSNMRRHLRVHRLGRGSSSGSNNGLETTNEE